MNKLNNNTIELQAILDAVNALPEAGGEGEGGVVLPELINEGSASDLLSGKQLINSSGNIVIGTIPTKTSSNLSASGATVTVPAGYYASQVTKSVASGSATTPATTITKNPGISVNSNGLITASISGTQNVTPTVTAGYVSSGTTGTITVNGSATKQLTTKSATTITPTKSTQTAVASGVYTTGAITVAPIPSEYIVPSGTKNITSNGTHDVIANASVSVNVPIPDGYVKPSGTKSVTTNGTHDIESYKNVNVNVQPNLQNKTITENGTYSADDGYDGLGRVTVNVPTGGGEDLRAVLEEQQQLIDTLQETLNNKASEELNMGTCTVKITVPSSSNYYVANETVSNGTVSYSITRSYTSTTITKTVRCDSIMYIQASMIQNATVTDGEVLQTFGGYGIVYKTPSLNNSTANVTLGG